MAASWKTVVKIRFGYVRISLRKNMKKVLIISYYFPPINMMAAKRYGTMCRYFEDHGYKPYVITTRCRKISWLNVKTDMECPIEKNQIITFGRADHNSIVESTCGAYILQMLRKKGYESRTVNYASLGWFEKVKKNINLEKFRDVKLIVGTFPPMENLFVACYLARKLHVPYIADIRDLISDYIETENSYRPTKKLDNMVEKYILSRASGIVTVTPGFRDILREKFPNKKFRVIFNGWDKDTGGKNSLQTVGRWEAEDGTDRYLYYAGSLYLHRLESFRLLVRCIKKVNEVEKNKIRFVVRSIGPKELDAKANNIVEQEGMREYVIILEAAPEGIVRAEQERAYINVVLSSIHANDRALMTTVPGKVYELMNEKAPVLAIVPKDSDVEKVLEYTNKGIASVKEGEIVDYIREEYKNYKGNRNILYFSRQKQAERLCSFFDEVLDT